MPEPINPVTFTGHSAASGKEIKLSIARIHLGSTLRKEIPDGQNRLKGPEVITKRLTCVVWEGNGDSMKPLAELIVDEDHFIRGLQHLFPKGELNLTD